MAIAVRYGQYPRENRGAGSDNVYLNENLKKQVPIAATLDADSNLKTQDRMKQLAGSPKLIVTGHDPAVMTGFPEAAPRVVRIQ